VVIVVAPTVWTISAKKLDPAIKYNNPFKKYEDVQPSDFLITKLEKEVKKERKKNPKSFAKICKIAITASALLLVVAHPTLAATIPAPLPVTIPNILPSDIVKAAAYLIGISTAASSLLAIVLSQMAGGYRMLRKGDEATKWTTDILKGYTQVILAPVIIGVIAFAVYLLFGSYDWFVKIF
jgi:hypothetical protein